MSGLVLANVGVARPAVALGHKTTTRRAPRVGAVSVKAQDYPKPPFEEAGTFQEAAALSTKLMTAPRPAQKKASPPSRAAEEARGS